MKNLLPIALVVVGIGLIGSYFFLETKNLESTTTVSDSTTLSADETNETVAQDTQRVSEPKPAPAQAAGKLKVANFSGKLEKVDVGCFADGECYVVVDGKHVTTTMGWSQETVGSVQGAASIGDLESHIGETIEVYARDNGDGTYSLYGSEGFYVKLI